MKVIFGIVLSIFSFNSMAQKRGDPKIYYWTIWFKTTAYPANYDSTDKGHDWVQSFSDPWEATNYYQNLKSTGKVTIWNKYLSRIDTASVYIDSFNLIGRKYSFESH